MSIHYTSPEGACNNCGEPLRWRPCTNCAELRNLEETLK